MPRDVEKSSVGISVAVLCDAENDCEGDSEITPVEATVDERQGWALDDASLHSTFSENRTCRGWTAEGVCPELLFVG
jgi:hypothetical protein